MSKLVACIAVLLFAAWALAIVKCSGRECLKYERVETGEVRCTQDILHWPRSTVCKPVARVMCTERAPEKESK